MSDYIKVATEGNALLVTPKASDITAVSAVVNGASLSLSLSGDVWRSEIAAAANGVYEVAIAATTATETVRERTTIYQAFAAVYDRTLADVEYGTAKGYYNASDLNRVEYACQYLQQYLAGCGYYVNITSRADGAWLMSDFPTQADTDRLLSNIQALADGYHILSNTPRLPTTLSGLNHTKANNIERVISDIKTLLDNMTSSYFYAGTELFGGDN